MNDERIDHLIDQHLNGAMSDEQRRELEERLLHSGTDRARFWELAEIHGLLLEGLQRKIGEPVARVPHHIAWLQWRQLTAAAAGVVFGLFCAAVAWAYAGPRAAQMIERVLPLVNGDFEVAEEPAADGMPHRYGVWSGDFSRVVGAEQGLQPKSGQHMLRVLRSDSRFTRPGEDTHVGDVIQLVDLRPFKTEVASGNAVIELSASANMVAARSGEEFTFRVVLLAFSGRPQDMEIDYSNLWQSAIASSANTLVLDGDPSTWQATSVRLLLPEKADFVMVKVPVAQEKPRIAGYVEFAGHYVDDVKLVLRMQTTQPVRMIKR